MELVGQHVLNKLAPEDLDGNADASGTVITVMAVSFLLYRSSHFLQP